MRMLQITILRARARVLALLALGVVGCGGTDAPTPGSDAGVPDLRRRDAAPAVDTLPIYDAWAPAPDTWAPAPDAAPPPPDAGPVGVEINRGWFGGSCAAPSDCSDPHISGAICETVGFPNGFCTQVCAGNLCPDANYATTGVTTSRCIDAAGQPRCVSECDPAKSPTGCRPGYVCVQRQRYGDPTRVFSVCLPGPYGLWPGEPAPAPLRAVGEPCLVDTECAAGVCLRWQGGYCTRVVCDDAAGCPAGSVCADVVINGAQKLRACVKRCTVAGECRAAESYGCAADRACRPALRPTWNPTVGANDCQHGWGVAGAILSACDAVKDNYIVVRKSARNLALCKAGALVQSHELGLGFSPLGDKVQVGDGKTPEGVFYISRLHPTSSYHKALVLSYPDKNDAARGLASGLISVADKAAIDAAQNACLEPPQTALGSLIEIHGGGGSLDWTVGCIAVTNAQIDALWGAVGLRDTVIVVP